LNSLIHTLPDPTPMPIILPNTAELDGRYFEGILSRPEIDDPKDSQQPRS
jgi:hypothetical protein